MFNASIAEHLRVDGSTCDLEQLHHGGQVLVQRNGPIRVLKQAAASFDRKASVTEQTTYKSAYETIDVINPYPLNRVMSKCNVINKQDNMVQIHIGPGQKQCHHFVTYPSHFNTIDKKTLKIKNLQLNFACTCT